MDTELERVSDALARTSKDKTTLEDRLQVSEKRKNNKMKIE